jgi:hypothetical protein
MRLHGVSEVRLSQVRAVLARLGVSLKGDPAPDPAAAESHPEEPAIA